MFNNIYEGKKVLVTGNTGFKGAWLTTWFLELGADVYGISNGVPSQPSMFDVLKLEENITYYEEDIRNLSAIVKIVKEVQPDFLFHLAAQPIVKTSYVDPVDTMTSNIIGTTHLLEALRLSNHECTAVFITSDKCYDNIEWVWGYREHDALGGKDPYSASKGAAELMIKTYYHSYFKKEDSNIKVSAVRAGNVIGGGDWAANRLIPDIVRSWSKNEAVEIRSPHATRPWQHVLEPLSGYLRAGQVLYNKPELNGEAYNFGPTAEQSKTVLELLVEISNNWDFEEGAERYNVHENPNFHEAGLLKLNCDKALHELQWKPTLAFEQTGKFTSEWYSAYYNDDKADLLKFTKQQIQEYIDAAALINNAWTK
jgi:CDP-glucose 4,6-dehydratase